MRESYPGSP